MNFETPMVPLAFSVNEMLGTFFCISTSSQQQCSTKKNEHHFCYNKNWKMFNICEHFSRYVTKLSTHPDFGNSVTKHTSTVLQRLTNQ